MIERGPGLAALRHTLTRPVDGASLAALRILLGIVMVRRSDPIHGIWLGGRTPG